MIHTLIGLIIGAAALVVFGLVWVLTRDDLNNNDSND